MITINLKALVDKLNAPARTALEMAASSCASRGHADIEIVHWLAHLLDMDDAELNAALALYGVDTGQLRNHLARTIDQLPAGQRRAPALSPELVAWAKSAWLFASLDCGRPVATPGHLLAALLADPKLRHACSFAPLMAISPESFCEIFRHNAGTSEDAFSPTTAPSAAILPRDTSRTPALDRFTVDLTALARQGGIDPVIGRDVEIRQLLDILSRRRQNNPILTGEAGVGKTAVVEGLALRIAADDVPPALRAAAIRTLDLGLLQAGASVKGEFENRLKSVIAEIKTSPYPIIMFIDEAHTIIGAGGNEGQSDAANLLKPALARGELRTIAATTWSEYKKYFERDAALTRRFQLLQIPEPSEPEAIAMLRAIAPTLQRHHRIRILDEAIVAAVQWSHRYIPARQLPDKCVSLLDTACARVALSQESSPPQLDDTRRNILLCELRIAALSREASLGGNHETLTLQRAHHSDLQRISSGQTGQWQIEKDLVREVLNIQEQIDSSHNDHEQINRPTFEQSIFLPEPADSSAASNEALQKRLLDKLAELRRAQGEIPMVHVHVNSQVVAEVVADWTGIPVGKMLADDVKTLLELETRLTDRIVGQSQAVASIARTLRSARLRLSHPGRPAGVFLLVGPSGVGKSETASALAECLYGGTHNLTTINMAEFKEPHKISMLLGSPPGYVGYGEGGVLTEAVRRRPYSVVLLDEIEKAHPGVQDIFYNLFDNGSIKDGEGRDIDFRNTVIIMTSNAGEEHLRAICRADEENHPALESRDMESEVQTNPGLGESASDNHSGDYLVKGDDIAKGGDAKGDDAKGADAEVCDAPEGVAKNQYRNVNGTSARMNGTDSIDSGTRDNTLSAEVLLENFRPQLLRYFKPAFLGRVTVIPYFPLKDEQLLRIAEMNLEKIRQRVRHQYDADLIYSDEVLLQLVARCADTDTGARGIESVITGKLLPAVADACLGSLGDAAADTTLRGLDCMSIDVSASGEITCSLTGFARRPDAVVPSAA